MTVMATQLSAKETHGLWSLDWVDATQFMRLDAGAMRALDPPCGSASDVAPTDSTPT